MKHKSYILDIPTPCTEKWTSMTPNGCGRFCAACSKTVVDFTRFTDNEIIQYIEKNANQKICGHLNHTQLHRTLQPQKREQSKTLRWTFLTTISAWLTAQQTQAQTTTNIPTPPQVQTTINTTQDIDNESKINNDTIVIKGVVTSSEDGFGLPNTTILLKEINQGFLTNFDGVFEMKIPANQLPDICTLQFLFVGFSTQEIQIYKSNLVNEIDVVLNPEYLQVDGDMLIIPIESPWHRTKRKTKDFFQRIFE